MILSVIALLVSFIPAVLLYLYFKSLYKEDDIYGKDCSKLLIKGILSSIAVAGAAFVLNILWALSGLDKVSVLLDAAFHAFVLAACTEEIVKFLTAESYMKKKDGGVPWIHRIVFTGIVGIGFSILESFVYMFSTNIIQILVRGITASHSSFGLWIGYYAGKAKKTGNRAWYIPGFAVSILVHGLYDLSLNEEFAALNDNLVFVPFLMLLIAFIILVRMLMFIHKNRNNEEFLTPLV